MYVLQKSLGRDEIKKSNFVCISLFKLTKLNMYIQWVILKSTLCAYYYSPAIDIHIYVNNLLILKYLKNIKSLLKESRCKHYYGTFFPCSLLLAPGGYVIPYAQLFTAQQSGLSDICILFSSFNIKHRGNIYVFLIIILHYVYFLCIDTNIILHDRNILPNRLVFFWSLRLFWCTLYIKIQQHIYVYHTFNREFVLLKDFRGCGIVLFRH